MYLGVAEEATPTRCSVFFGWGAFESGWLLVHVMLAGDDRKAASHRG